MDRPARAAGAPCLRVSLACLCLALGLGALVGSARARQEDARRYLGPGGALLPFADAESVRHFLRTAEIVDVEDLSTGITHPRRLTLEEDGVRARAVFKSVDIEQDSLHMRDGGVYAAFYDRASSEMAAYELASMLGIDMVPPTVWREVGGEPGAVQLWIEDAMTEGERIQRRLQPPDHARWRRQHRIMEFFDGLIYNADRNTGNSLIDAQWNLWLIDHTRTFQRPRGRNEFPLVQQVPRPLWEKFLALEDDSVRARLGPYLEGLQLDALLRRRDDLRTHVEELIRRRGEGAVLIS